MLSKLIIAVLTVICLLCFHFAKVIAVAFLGISELEVLTFFIMMTLIGCSAFLAGTLEASLADIVDVLKEKNGGRQ